MEFERAIGVDWGRVFDVANLVAGFTAEWAGVACLAAVVAAGIRRRFGYERPPVGWFTRGSASKFGRTSMVNLLALGLDAALFPFEILGGIYRKRSSDEPSDGEIARSAFELARGTSDRMDRFVDSFVSRQFEDLPTSVGVDETVRIPAPEKAVAAKKVVHVQPGKA